MIAPTKPVRRAIDLVIGVVSVVFCMIGSVAVASALRMPLENVLDDLAGPIGLGIIIVGWIGGGTVLRGWLTRRWDRGRKRSTALLLVAIAAAIPAMAVLITRVQPAWDRFETKFGPHADEYMARTADGGPSVLDRIRGRCVVVNDGKIDNTLMGALPRRLRAETPDEVSSVVQLRYEHTDLSSPPGAWVDTCRITVIDARTGRQLAQHTLQGVWREKRDKKKGPYWTGELHYSEVNRFLRGLPHTEE